MARKKTKSLIVAKRPLQRRWELPHPPIKKPSPLITDPLAMVRVQYHQVKKGGGGGQKSGDIHSGLARVANFMRGQFKGKKLSARLKQFVRGCGFG